MLTATIIEPVLAAHPATAGCIACRRSAYGMLMSGGIYGGGDIIGYGDTPAEAMEQAQRSIHCGLPEDGLGADPSAGLMIIPADEDLLHLCADAWQHGGTTMLCEIDWRLTPGLPATID